MNRVLRSISRDRQVIGVWLTYVYLVGCCGVAWAEEEAAPRSVSNERYQVSFAGETASEAVPAKANYAFNVVNYETGKAQRFVLRGDFKPINEVQVYMTLPQKDMLVIQTRWKKRTKPSTGMYIVDLKTSKLIDEFCCYTPVLSPLKNVWVYEKNYLPHELPAARTTVVLMYDLRKSPSENRVPVVGYTPYPLEQVGIPVYPQPYVKAKAYVLPEQQMENPNWYSLSSPFLWSEDSNDVVFLCNHQQVTYIARVNISGGIDKPAISEAPVNVARFIKADLPEDYREREAARLHSLSATKIVWDDKDHVIITPDKAYYTLEPKIRLSVP